MRPDLPFTPWCTAAGDSNGYTASVRHSRGGGSCEGEGKGHTHALDHTHTHTHARILWFEKSALHSSLHSLASYSNPKTPKSQNASKSQNALPVILLTLPCILSFWDLCGVVLGFVWG